MHCATYVSFSKQWVAKFYTSPQTSLKALCKVVTTGIYGDAACSKRSWAWPSSDRPGEGQRTAATEHDEVPTACQDIGEMWPSRSDDQMMSARAMNKHVRYCENSYNVIT